MAHRLIPHNGEALLSPKQIVRRLRAEFAYVYADANDADFYLAALIDLGRKSNDARAIAYYEAMIGKAMWIKVSDREFHEDDHISLLAKPEEPLWISYRDGFHENAAATLLERMCKVLRYQAKLE